MTSLGPGKTEYGFTESQQALMKARRSIKTFQSHAKTLAITTEALPENVIIFEDTEWNFMSITGLLPWHFPHAHYRYMENQIATL